MGDHVRVQFPVRDIYLVCGWQVNPLVTHGQYPSALETTGIYIYKVLYKFFCLFFTLPAGAYMIHEVAPLV